MAIINYNYFLIIETDVNSTHTTDDIYITDIQSTIDANDVHSTIDSGINNSSENLHSSKLNILIIFLLSITYNCLQ